MSARYTEFHPRWYRRRMSVFWWVGRRSYLIFVLRELSSVFVVWSVVFCCYWYTRSATAAGSISSSST